MRAAGGGSNKIAAVDGTGFIVSGWDGILIMNRRAGMSIVVCWVGF